MASGQSEDTVITRAHSGKPCRVVRSDWIDAWNDARGPRAPGHAGCSRC
jgi:NAD(P)H-dependent flavin oxidoreductase YrpB (nitropropane dioxygenase family)